MLIRVGYQLTYEFSQPTPMLLMLSIHHSRTNDLVSPECMRTEPSVPLSYYRDTYGNWCTRVLSPAGEFRLSADAIVRDTGSVDAIVPSAQQHAVQDLPEETLVFLLGSRYCDTDVLSETAWSLFSGTPTGWARVQAICDFVHEHITFGYEHARSTKTASEAFRERVGVCRDYTHLAITFCRCMNIPARYCTGYLGDMGMPPPYGPADFSAWFEVYLDGEWHIFDARNNVPRIGRVLIARGRDATDVPISNSFGPNVLKDFQVWTDVVEPPST